MALLDRRSGSGSRPTASYFCSGSLIAPDLVITAAHCVDGYTTAELANVSVIAGRTYLNQTSTGESLRVDRRIMAVDAQGRRKFRVQGGTAVWDVALLKLASPSSAGSPIKVAGATEVATWRSGRLVRTTGWGVTNGSRGSVSNRLRVASQVILPDGVCRRDGVRNYYKPTTMLCLGGPRGGSSACSGDSGGPLVSPLRGGTWRLIGLTSFGDLFCRGNVPSVDNRTGADPIRSWVRNQALAAVGVDPIGKGGEVGPLPRSCMVPGLGGKTRASAKKALRKAGCSLKAVRSVDGSSVRKGRVVGASLPAGWLVPWGFGITIQLAR